MKLKLLLIGLALSVATVVAATKPAKTGKAAVQEKAAPTVSKQQADKMERAANDILAAASGKSGPEEVFKFVNGQKQTEATDRSDQLSDAINSAVENGLKIVCYKESKIVAATDSSLIGKEAGDFKTSDGRTVLDVVVDGLRKSPNDRALVTCEKVSGNVSDKEAMYALGRNSFPFGKEEGKYLLMVSASIS
ncbi:MAG: hypothetical protein NT128_07815 [Proteobacteria bacterium]|nr:hypothetical protein [Pseudomonadota bacterium]